MSGHIHPTSPDYLLLDQVHRDLDGKLAKDCLPIHVAVAGLDVEAMSYMANVRAMKALAHVLGLAAQEVNPRPALRAMYMDGFTAGVMFQRAKTQGE